MALKVELLPWHTATSVPAYAVGNGLTTMALQLVELVPQLLPAVTQILPEELPKVTIIEVVPCPDDIDAPDGTVHVYEVAPVTDDML